MSYFSVALEQILGEHGLTQVEAAQKAGVSQAQISRYLNSEDRPMPRVLKQICSIFPRSDSVRLWVAYFRDTVPEEIEDLIEIRETKTGAKVKLESPPFAEKPTPLRRFLERAAHACEQRAGMQKALESVLDMSGL